MSAPVVTALIYAAVPTVVAIVGTAFATIHHPNDAVRSGLLHFAAGVSFAVVAVELLPRVMRSRHALPWILAGFGAGRPDHAGAALAGATPEGSAGPAGR